MPTFAPELPNFTRGFAVRPGSACGRRTQSPNVAGIFDHASWRKRKHGYVRRLAQRVLKSAYTLPGRSLIANTGCKALLSSGAASASAPLPT